jgi:endonuclease/exonuclease/phosphatase family metal-dependent hydrolase
LAQRKSNRVDARRVLLVVLLLWLVLLGAWWLWQHRPARTAAPTTGPASGQVRLATWNLRQFSTNRPMDMRMICRIIQQGAFDLVALQEIKGDAEIVDRLLVALEAPWRSTSISPRTGNSERFAFIYRGDRLSELGKARFVTQPSAQSFARQPYQASFRSGAFDFTLISVHLSYEDRPRRRAEMAALARLAADLAGSSQEKDVIVLGDFNEERVRPNLHYFESQGWTALIRQPTNLKSREVFDNLLIDPRFTREFTGQVGVLNFDETFYNNDDQAAMRQVSDHRPAWATFSTVGPDDD